MKRHPALEPFSRDHNDGLIVARHLSMNGTDALAEFRKAWDDELRDHFAEEERLLLPLCPPEEAERLRREHAAIEDLGLSASNAEDAERLGQLLHDHIRWEERELFVAIERAANEATLRSLGHATATLEHRRGEANALRAELVKRRPGLATEPILADFDYLARSAGESGPQWGMESSDLNGTLLTWERGHEIVEHVNAKLDVLLVVVAGVVQVRIEDEPVELRAGQSVLIPKGARRTLTVLSDRATYLTVHRRRFLELS